MSDRHGRRLIQAAKIVSNIGHGGPLPQTEKHTRPLVEFETEEQREVWDKVVAAVPGGDLSKITEGFVRTVVREHKGLPPLPTPSQARKLAQEHDGSFAATDGYYYDARTPEQIKEETYWINVTGSLYEAIASIVKLRKENDLQEVLDHIPDYRHDAMDLVCQAAESLTLISKLWKERID